tara:strand:- start:530 stop:796 length:267 start_codon:yes stop_codon:yes gene_type:complete
MKKLFATAALIPFLVLSGAALADGNSEEGKIASMNTWSITLENGMLFTVYDAKAIKDLKPGDTVKVNYVEPPESNFIATKIERGAAAQ